MKKIIGSLGVLILVIIVAVGTLTTKNYEETVLDKLRDSFGEKHIPSVDHSKFARLQKEFHSPNEVTAECIECHNKRHEEVMHSNHWNWEREEYIEGRGIVSIGKKNAMNNFCIGTQGNEKSCAKCHIGYGMDEKGFSFTDANNIDCLVCHDNTETYAKAPNAGGEPLATLNFNKIAENVGKPKRSNCGVCHFFGGGGDNVKHGDLSSLMFEPSSDIDVHMAIDGMDLQCVDCHTTEQHIIAGKMYSLSSMNHNRIFCEDCHTATPHEKEILNEHTLKVACQTCHIPIYAKEKSTKMTWDWSKAGKLKNGQPYHEEDSLGNHTYLSIKGSFTWDRNIKPEYQWFNGTASHYLEGDVIDDTTKALVMNELHGSYKDSESKIIPVKVHRAIQPFDPVNKILIQPKLYSDNKGEGAFWQDFNWQTASKEGMKDAGLPFSGNISFIHTEMNWPINHQVSSAINSVHCSECHTRENSRLAQLNDFYMPGRDYSKVVDFLGIWNIILAIVGIIIHGSLRIFAAKKLNNGVKNND
ncbi:MAG: tetrathionate reductase family octaheme c-type cytochrome [Ignavibacteriales bacterium]|nr:tetrathionate reductase family octaheme c-type cytochrome [Ignavibacteriales bacterium]